MNKHISKKIMKRSKLRNKFLKTWNNTDKFNYNKQGNFCVPLYEKENQNIFQIYILNTRWTKKNFGKLLNSAFKIWKNSSYRK